MLTACSSENIWDYDGSQAAADEYVDVTFQIASETIGLSSRAGDDSTVDDSTDNGGNKDGGPGRWQTLGKGKKIDMLVYAVYDANEKDDNGKKTLVHLTQYGEGLKAADGQVAFTSGTPENPGTPALSMEDNTHKGQTIVNVGDILAKGDSYTVTLRLMRQKEYTIAFWAQSSQSKAYDTNDLRHVEVLYKNGNDNFINNDETRDAFCKAETFMVPDGGINHQTVILTRPLAQINVGTTGADYKNLEKGAIAGSTHRHVSQSKIEIKGVAKYLDVAENKVLTGDDIQDATTNPNSPYYGVSGKATTDVIFDWAKIPAYYNIDIPTENLYIKAAGEELLYVDLNQDGTLKDYKTSYPTLGSKGSYMTEQFKYLSMSYVLVGAPKSPSSSDSNGSLSDDANSSVNNSKVIDNVTVWFAESNENGKVTNEFQSLTVSQVPARSNWRTNILGGLQWMKDPTDTEKPTDPDDPNPYDDPDYSPDDPDNPTPNIPEGKGPDPSTIFNSAYLKPTIISDFINDINGTHEEDSDKEGSDKFEELGEQE